MKRVVSWAFVLILSGASSGLCWVGCNSKQKGGEVGSEPLAERSDPASTQPEEEESQQVEITTEAALPEYNPKEFTVRPGVDVALRFRNGNSQGEEQGLIITLPGKENENVAPLILAKTRPLMPGEMETIVFRAPSLPGDYPFIWPSSGNWGGMRGVMHVRQE